MPSQLRLSEGPAGGITQSGQSDLVFGESQVEHRRHESQRQRKSHPSFRRTWLTLMKERLPHISEVAAVAQSPEVTGFVPLLLLALDSMVKAQLADPVDERK